MRAGALRRTLGVFETAGVSVAMMAPTAAMALNGALAATYAGAAVPLAFVLAFAMIACVTYSFVVFARVYASAASVGEYNARGLGPFAGRLSGWMLLLVYVLFTAGSAAEFGAFAGAAIGYAHATVSWFPLALACLAIAAIVGTRPARVSTRTMLGVEGVSVLAIVALSLLIVARGGAHGLSLAPFTAPPRALGGLGLGTVFALLSFAGFEGAAVLGAESLAPTRTIPRALIASVVLAGTLYVFVAYAQTIGFGTDARGVATFAGSASPLVLLAERYTGTTVAALIGAGAAVSAFAATLASATGAARLAMSFAVDGYGPRAFARVGGASGTPAPAYLTTLAVSVTVVSAFAAAHVSGTDTFAACGTVAVLALLAVYAAVQVAALRLFGARLPRLQRVVPVIAFVSLAATFVANVVPIPAWPTSLYPYVVALWFLIGSVTLRDVRGRAAGLRRREE